LRPEESARLSQEFESAINKRTNLIKLDFIQMIRRVRGSVDFDPTLDDREKRIVEFYLDKVISNIKLKTLKKENP